MLNHKITALMMVIALCSLTACQKESPNHPQSAHDTESSDQKIEKQVKTDLSTEKENLSAQSCETIDANIQLLKQQFSPKHLVSLNEQFKRCLTAVGLEQRYTWLSETDEVYAYQISKLPENVSNFIRQVSNDGNTLTETQLKQMRSNMTEQEKFIVDHQKDVYLTSYNLGEGDYAVAQSPEYASEIFAATLPKADQIFLKATLEQEHAIDGSIDKDAGLSVSFDQLSRWIIFWQDYLKKYPESHFAQDTQITISLYEKYLFLGLENTPVFEINDYSVDIYPEALKAIAKLSKTDSPSARKAQQLIDYFDHYAFTESQLDEATATQAEYNAFMNETQQGIQRFRENYSDDLVKLLKLKTD